MIAWLLALSKPRLIAYGVAGAAILGAATWAWVTVSGWRSDSERLPVVERQRDALAATVKLAADELDRNARIANDYHDQVARLRADLRERPIRVRVCPPAARPVLPPGTAPRTDAPAAGPEPGPPAETAPAYDVDLSPYAEDAAATADQLRALQEWVRERP